VTASNDGKTIAARRNQRTGEIWEVPISGGPADLKSRTQGKENIVSLAAADNGTVVFNAPQDDAMTLWAMKADGGRVSLSPRGTTVLSHRLLRGQNATAFTAYGTDLVGHVHRVDLDGNNAKQLTTGTGETLIDVSPDGKYILYNTPQAPQTLMVLASDGSGSPRQLVTDFIAGAAPNLIFSRDGRIVSYQRIDSSQQQVVNVRTFIKFDDGAVIAVLPARRGDQITPDGTAVSFIQLQSGATPGPVVPATVFKVPLAGGAPQKLFEMPESRPDLARWADDKTVVIAAFSLKNPVTNLWRGIVGTIKPVPLTDFRAGLIFEMASSEDGKTIYFTQGSNNRDIIKITGLVK
jgi:hypothetical protein